MQNVLGQVAAVIPLLMQSASGARPDGVGVPEQMGPGVPGFARGAFDIPKLPPLDFSSGINKALDENRKLAMQRQQQRSGGGGLFGGGLGNFLGRVGDAMLVASGGKPMYGPRQQQRTVSEAMARLGANPQDAEALQTIYGVDPELGMRVEDQLHERGERKRGETFRSATADLLLGGEGQGGAAGGGTDGMRPEAYERAVRASPTDFLTFEGKRLDVTDKGLKATRDINDFAMQILGGVHDQASYDDAKEQVAAMLQQYGVDPSVFALPDTYTPESIRNLQLRGMDTSKQLQAIARENRLQWDMEDDRADNERADRNQRSLERKRQQPSARASGAPNSEGALYARIMDRWRKGESINAREREFVRAYEARRASRGRRSSSSRSSDRSAIIVNPKTGQRMKLQGGKWVPIR